MNPYPGPNSVIVLDNAKIHHNEDLIRYLQAFGIRVEFLPPYSPDLNPIESAFSVMKSFLKKNRDFIESFNDPIYALFIASFHITSVMAEGFFKGTIYL
jgi:transposase